MHAESAEAQQALDGTAAPFFPHVETFQQPKPSLMHWHQAGGGLLDEHSGATDHANGHYQDHPIIVDILRFIMTSHTAPAQR